MFRKTFLLFSLLVCTCGEVFAHDANTTDTSFIHGERPDWFSKYCDSDSIHYDETICIHHLTGIRRIKNWNDVYFDEHGETTITMLSFESGFKEGHPENQLKEIKNIISGDVFQCIGSGCYYRGVNDQPWAHFWDRFPGDIATIASGKAFASGSIGYITNINRKQVVVVTGAGNYGHKSSADTVVKATSKTWRVHGLEEEIIKQPFALIAGGMSVSYWLTNCKENSNHCGLFRAGKIPPSPDSEGWGASRVCGERGKEICILAPFSTVVGNGTSISTAYLGATVWAVAYFLKNKYGWVEPMTQLQAAVTAVAIIKSCAKDIDPPGPDYENGLGALSLHCLYDDNEEDGFIANPLPMIKEKFHLVPDEYVKPKLASANPTGGEGNKPSTKTTVEEPPPGKTTPTDMTEPPGGKDNNPPPEEPNPLPPEPPKETTPVVVVVEPPKEETTPTDVVKPPVDGEEKPSTPTVIVEPSTPTEVVKRVGIRVRVKLFLEWPLR